MATIGIKGFWVANYAEAATGSTGYVYSAGKKIAKAVQADTSYTIAEQAFYADNGKDDEVRAVTGVDVTLTPNDVNIDWENELGLASETITINGDEVSIKGLKSSTEGGFRGLAFIENVRESGTEKCAVRIFPKVKFHMADSKSVVTKGESITFNTQTIVATGFADTEGNFELYPTERFASEAAATAYIANLFNVSGIGG